MIFLLILVVGLLLSPLLGADSRDGHDWMPHYLFPYPGSDGDVGDYWCEKIGLHSHCAEPAGAVRWYQSRHAIPPDRGPC